MLPLIKINIKECENIEEEIINAYKTLSNHFQLDKFPGRYGHIEIAHGRNCIFKNLTHMGIYSKYTDSLEPDTVVVYLPDIVLASYIESEFP